MAFHFQDREAARTALYDAAVLILEADLAVSLQPLSLATVQELSALCRAIEGGRKVSRSPVLDL
jgi:hypothetical protein